jgi:glyoxylase-like metal-dependent hydrolase (beta-lactamase superfamily II)
MGKENITTIEMTFVNAFLVKVREGFVLIDTGLGMHWERLETELISSGCLPDKLKLVIITHGDFDHTGNCAKLQRKYKCRIAMHNNDSPMVENGLFVKRKVRTLKAKIFILIRMLFRRKFVFDKFKPDIYLIEGQNLNEYGFNATVVHIPGHTKGSIGIITDDGNLFAGDIFINIRKPDIATYIENPGELKNSIDRLKKMNIKTVYPGHGKPFEMEQIARKL